MAGASRWGRILVIVASPFLWFLKAVCNFCVIIRRNLFNPPSWRDNISQKFNTYQMICTNPNDHGCRAYLNAAFICLLCRKYTLIKYIYQSLRKHRSMINSRRKQTRVSEQYGFFYVIPRCKRIKRLILRASPKYGNTGSQGKIREFIMKIKRGLSGTPQDSSSIICL